MKRLTVIALLIAALTLPGCWSFWQGFNKGLQRGHYYHTPKPPTYWCSDMGPNHHPSTVCTPV